MASMILHRIDLNVVLNSREKNFVTELYVWTLENGPRPFMGFQGVDIHVSRPLVVDLTDSAKCSQWPYLYKTYKATYTLECLVIEEIAKNRFLAPKLVFRMLFKTNSNISKTKGLRALQTSCVCHNVLIAVILHRIWGLSLHMEAKILIF
jgi:hypothetical protein